MIQVDQKILYSTIYSKIGWSMSYGRFINLNMPYNYAESSHIWLIVNPCRESKKPRDACRWPSSWPVGQKLKL